jgi:DNA-binding CsgD family transcriptional regulator
MWSMLFTEHDLVAVPGAVVPEGAPHLVNDWLSSGSTTELQQRIRRALQAMDFDWMTYGGVPSTTKLDPRLQQALSSTLPLVWSADDAGSWGWPPNMTTQQLRFPELLRGCDIRSGVLVVLPVRPRSDERTVVGLASRKPGREWIDDSVLGQTLMFALCLHEVLTIHMCAADASRGALVSPKRQEILRHLAQGQSNKQIAYRLELSADTVKYHMRELRRHFKVNNRMQLVNSLMCRDER